MDNLGRWLENLKLEFHFFSSLNNYCALNFHLPLQNESNAITNKWLLISDPEDMLTAGAKGYLKVSVLVLRAGDVAPTVVEVFEDESDDIES